MPTHIAPIGAHARLQRDREHGEQWLTCLDCGAQWHDDDALEQVSDGDGSCDACDCGSCHDHNADQAY